MHRAAPVLTCAFLAALPAVALGRGTVALGTGGYDGEPCGETGPFTDACLSAPGLGRTRGPRFLLLALPPGLALLALRRMAGARRSRAAPRGPWAARKSPLPKSHASGRSCRPMRD